MIHVAVVVGLLAQALLHSIVPDFLALKDISCISALLKKSSIA